MDDYFEIRFEDLLSLLVEKANALILVLLISMMLAFAFFSFSPKVYESTTTIEIPRQASSITDSRISVTESTSSLEGQIRLYGSDNVISSAIEKYNDDNELILDPIFLKSNLTISRNRQNPEIVDIFFRSSDPIFANSFLTVLNESFAEERLEYIKKDLYSAIFFLDEEIPALIRKLEEAEKNLAEQTKLIGSSELKTEESKVRFLESLNDQINVIRLRELEIKEFYREDHPLYQTLLLQKNLLENEKLKLQENIENLSNDQFQIEALKAQVNVFSDAISDLRERRINYSLEAASTVDNLKINRQPSPPNIISPTQLIFTIPFLLTLFSYFAFFIVRAFKSVIVDEEGIRKVTMNDNFIGSLADETFDSSENFEINDELKKKVVFNLKDRLKVSKTISVVSSRGDVGKSFLCAELFSKLTEQGLNVCLIDADYRKKTTTKFFLHDIRIPKDLEEIKTNESKFMIGNSIVIPAVDTKNPIEILESKAFSNLYEDLTNRFDVVIVDTPPWFLFVDAEIVSRLTSSILYVAKSHQTSEKDLTSFLEVVKNLNKDIYFVLNFLKLFNKVLNYKVGYPKYSYQNYYSYGSYYDKPKISKKSKFFAILPPPFRKFINKWFNK